MAFMISRYGPSIPTFLRVFIKMLYFRMLYFVKWFLCMYGQDPMVPVLSFTDVMYHINCFADIEPVLHPRYKSHVVVVNNFFNVLLFLVG